MDQDPSSGAEAFDHRWWRGVGRVRRRRSVRAGAVLAVLVLVAGAGYGAGRRVADRSQAAQERRGPPAPTLLTEPVVEARIAPSVAGPVRTSAGPRAAIDCVPDAPDDARQVFTAAPVPSGTSVTEGMVLAEINARPVMALAGPAPTYRSLVPDQRGKDVLQLQEALARLGFGDGTVDGHYGPATWSAVEELYRSRGYEPVGPTDEAVAAVDAASDAVGAAADRARVATTQAEYDQAMDERAAARDQLARLRATTGPSVPFCEIVFVPTLPAVAAPGDGAEEEAAASEETGGETEAVGAEQGGPGVVVADAPWLWLGTGAPTAELVLSADAARTVVPGLVATLTSVAGGAELTGLVRSVRPGAPAVAVVAFAASNGPPAGASGTLSIALPAPDDPMLAVSVAAPVRAADGTTTVVRLGADGGRRTVRVTLGPTDGSLVGVRSAEPALHVGDELLVGVRGR